MHLNFPLREPLAPAAEELAADDWAGRADGKPWVEVWEPPASAAAGLVTRSATRAARWSAARAPTLAAVEPITALAAATGWPILAEPTSGLRCGAHDRSHVIAHYDVLLRDEGWADAHVPRMAIRVGDTPTSKPLRAWLARTEQVVLDPYSRGTSRRATAQWIAAADPALTCADLARDDRRAERTRAGSRNGAPRTSWSHLRSPTRPTRSSRRCWAALADVAARRRDGLGQLVDADPRRRDLLPLGVEPDPVPREPRRERDRRRRVVGRGRGAGRRRAARGS